ncbi:isopentenyl-diphosphate Delta-isomerase [Nocardia sp. BSTN01]|nr:isopentenyl-diphosphate Delta-isomerase [Nocardia sp. BSTN01]
MTVQSVRSQLVVLCGPNGEAIGYRPKNRVHHRSTPLHLAFSSYVFDDRAQLLVTRRAHSKPTWPGVLTNTCCGHPEPAEPLVEAVERRIMEELGIAVHHTTLVLPSFSYRAEMANGIVENELCPVYVARAASIDMHPDPAEVAEATWMPWTAFATQVLDSSLLVSPWCKSQVEQLTLLGPDPAEWPTGDPNRLPAAAVHWRRRGRGGKGVGR